MKKKRGFCYQLAAWAEGRLPAERVGSNSGAGRILAAQRQKELAVCERLYGKGTGAVRCRTWRIERREKILKAALCGCGMALLLLAYS